MPQQPESPSPSLSVSPAPFSAQPPANYGANSSPNPPDALESHSGVPEWLVQVELFLRVFLRMLIGIVLVFTPWLPIAWDQNPILLRFPALGHVAAFGAVRGMVTGLGLLNLWIAFQDALRRRDG